MRDIAFGVAWGYAIVIIVAGVGYILCKLLELLENHLSGRDKLKLYLVYDGSDFGLGQIRASSFESLYNQLAPILTRYDYWVVYEAQDPNNADTWICVGSSIDHEEIPF